jgi:hypothetical protein
MGRRAGREGARTVTPRRGARLGAHARHLSSVRAAAAAHAFAPQGRRAPPSTACLCICSSCGMPRIEAAGSWLTHSPSSGPRSCQSRECPCPAEFCRRPAHTPPQYVDTSGTDDDDSDVGSSRRRNKGRSAGGTFKVSKPKGELAVAGGQCHADALCRSCKRRQLPERRPRGSARLRRGRVRHQQHPAASQAGRRSRCAAPHQGQACHVVKPLARRDGAHPLARRPQAQLQRGRLWPVAQRRRRPIRGPG